MKTIIVGGGIMGLSTAWALARLGHDVALLEQGPLPNPLASSMDEHRLIRHPYGAEIGYARMIDQAYAAWELMWSDIGQCLYAATGTLVLTGSSDTWAQCSAAALATIGKPMTELAITDLPRRFPQLDAKGVERAFWIDTGGALFAQDIVARLVGHLAQHPVVALYPKEAVRKIDLEHGRIVTESGGEHAGDIVVVAAGAWVTRLLPAFGKRLVPSRQTVAYFDLPQDQRAAWAKSPMVIDKAGTVGLYLVPPTTGRGLKVGDHAFSRIGDPASDRDASEAEIARLIARCRDLIRGFGSWRLERLKVCYYTVTDDERFVVEKLGSRGWLMSPCSGHGFKFGALMGLELAQTIVEERDPTAHARWAAGLEGQHLEGRRVEANRAD